MAIDRTRISNSIRDDSPCRDCTRPEKRPGCHDHCKFHKEWKLKIEQVKAAKHEYEVRMGFR